MKINNFGGDMGGGKAIGGDGSGGYPAVDGVLWSAYEDNH